MPTVNLRKLTERNLKLYYAAAYTDLFTQQVWRDVVQRIDTNQPDGEEFSGISRLAGMQDVRGDTQFQTLRAFEWTIRNREWGNGFTISWTVWRHNKVGLVQKALDDLAAQAAEHPGLLFEETLPNLPSITGPDGAAFVSANHPGPGGTSQVNDLTATQISALNITGSVPTVDEAIDIMLNVAQYMQLYRDEQGHYISRDSRRFYIVLPTSLYLPFWKAVSQNRLASGEDNPLNGLQGSFKPILSPYLTDSDKGYFVAAGRSAFVYQVLEEPNKLDVTRPDSEVGISRQWNGFAGVHGVYNVGVTPDWQRVARFTVS